MIARKTGRVVFIASESALSPAPEMAHYSATKTMQLSISRSLAELTKGTAVTVNTVLPGSTRTDGVARLIQDIYPGLPPEDAQRKFMQENRPTSLIERLPGRAGKRFITISPMPRVDGGLELVTSDGELGVKLQRSVRSLVGQFSVRVLGELSPQQLEGILGGILDSGQQLEVESCTPSGGEAANRWYTLVARGASGKDVRQLFERQGALVSRVQRAPLGRLTMARSLGRGQFREPTEEELQALTTPSGS